MGYTVNDYLEPTIITILDSFKINNIIIKINCVKYYCLMSTVKAITMKLRMDLSKNRYKRRRK